MFDNTVEVKNFTKVASYTVLVVLVVNAIKNLPRYKDVPDEQLVLKAYTALKERAKRAKPAIDGGQPWS